MAPEPTEQFRRLTLGRKPPEEAEPPAMVFILLKIPVSPPRDPASTWAAIAVGVLAIVYVVYVRPLRKKKEEADPVRRAPTHGGLSQQRAVEREMSNLLVEFSQMARQMTAQLDTRATKLELLLKEADEKIATLRAIGAGHCGTPTLPAPAAEAASAAAAALEGVIIEARAPIGPSLIEPPRDPRHLRSYELADEGDSPQALARHRARPRGELVVRLARRSGSPA